MIKPCSHVTLYLCDSLSQQLELDDANERGGNSYICTSSSNNNRTFPFNLTPEIPSPQWPDLPHKSQKTRHSVQECTLEPKILESVTTLRLDHLGHFLGESYLRERPVCCSKTWICSCVRTQREAHRRSLWDCRSIVSKGIGAKRQCVDSRAAKSKVPTLLCSLLAPPTSNPAWASSFFIQGFKNAVHILL